MTESRDFPRPASAMQRMFCHGALRRVLALVFFSFSVMAVGGRASADVVWLDDGSRIFGRITNVDEDGSLQLRQRLTGPDGDVQWIERAFSPDRVIQWHINVDEPLLESLSHGEWEPYLALADELSAQAVDPVARELALRLYLIVVRHGSAAEAGPAWTGALEMAQGKDRQRLLFLSGGERRAGDLTEKTGTSRQPAFDRTQAAALASAIRSLRLGDASRLKRLAREPATRELVGELSVIVTWDRFQLMVDNRDADFGQLADWIALELALSEMATSDEPSDKWRTRYDSNWAQLVPLQRPAMLPFTLESVTSFDLLATEYHKGGWVVAGADGMPDRSGMPEGSVEPEGSDWP